MAAAAYMPQVKGFPETLAEQALDDALGSGAAVPVLAISGLQGSGKSTLAAQVVARARARDLNAATLVPGLVDLQVNGGGGLLFNDDPTVETIAHIGATHRRFGTTAFLPTLVSDKPAVMAAAIAAGAAMINDVTALGASGALPVVARSQVAVCLMHMQGEPRNMQSSPRYDDVLRDVHQFLAGRVAACEAAGMDRSRIVIDPGFGFGKTLEHNIALLAGLEEFTRDGLPVLAGLSRKSMIGTLTGRAPGERLAGSIALAALAVMHGAAIVRAHDVAATVDAVKIAAAVRREAARRSTGWSQ